MKEDNYSIKSHFEKNRKIIYFFMIFTLLFTILTFLRNLNLPSYTISNIINRFKEVLQNPKLGYLQDLTFGGKFYTYIFVLTSPITWSTIALGFYYFKELNKKLKFIFIVILFFETLSWLMIGTNKGLIDLAIIFILVFLVKTVLKENNERKSVKNTLLFSFIFMVLLLALIFFFMRNIGNRLGDYVVEESKYYTFREFYFTSGKNSLWDKFLHLFTPYMTQGFYGLSLMFDNSSPHLLVIGNSPFLIEQINDVFNVDYSILLLQFQNISDTGWHPTSNWHSLYTSIANAYGFTFVPFVMGFYGFIFGKSYKNFINNKNILDLLLFILMTIMIIYIPANNQIMSYPKTAFTYIVILYLWIFNIKGGIRKGNVMEGEI